MYACSLLQTGLWKIQKMLSFYFFVLNFAFLNFWIFHYLNYAFTQQCYNFLKTDRILTKQKPFESGCNLLSVDAFSVKPDVAPPRQGPYLDLALSDSVLNFWIPQNLCFSENSKIQGKIIFSQPCLQGCRQKKWRNNFKNT